MSREHAAHIIAWVARWKAATPEERRAELDRLDGLGFAEARERASHMRHGDFGATSAAEAPRAAPAAEPEASIAEAPPRTPLAEPEASGAKFEASHPPLVAYTDGSGTIATKPCGAGVVVYDGDEVVLEVSRHLGNGTNNRAELCGIGLALAVTDEPAMRERPLVIYSDSTYAIGAISAARDPWDGAANEKLICYVRSLLAGRCVTFVHVRGHSGVEGNERADKLAGLARLRVPVAKNHEHEAMRRAG